MCIFMHGVNKSDNRITDGKLLSNNKMSLIHQFHSSAFLVIRHIVSTQQDNNNLLTN